MSRDDALTKDLRTFVSRAGRCSGCRGTKTFDHGSGVGAVEKCIYDDRSTPPHRYCPCQECGATGLTEEARELLARLD